MSKHDYTPEAALELLFRKLAERDTPLAAQIHTAVDQGKDIQERESTNGNRRRKFRVYRKTVPYPYDEALQVALNALAACFVEQPMFVDSCLRNMAPSPLGYPTRPEKTAIANLVPDSEGRDKDVQIELRTETQLPAVIDPSLSIHELQPLRPIPQQQISEQLRNLARLKELFDFREE
ncbi:MAG: hypothetical protein WBD87_04305 [Candidatus Acidiferrales bacterium]